jgi:serine protease
LLAQEATRAAAHFGVTGAALANANFVIIQPPGYSDPNALNTGYCAFHDFTEPGNPGNFYYNDPGVQKDIAYTNMPYSLAINSSFNGGPAVNVCGENAVNNDAAGKLDGFSIVLGHEIEETITDPGAESVVGNVTTGPQTYYGGWYDATDPNENGDKCAWVGLDPTTGAGPPVPVPGALGNITGNAGGRFAVQSIWSNTANAGTGYCAGAGTDSPLPNGP